MKQVFCCDACGNAYISTVTNNKPTSIRTIQKYFFINGRADDVIWCPKCNKNTKLKILPDYEYSNIQFEKWLTDENPDLFITSFVIYNKNGDFESAGDYLFHTKEEAEAYLEEIVELNQSGKNKKFTFQLFIRKFDYPVEKRMASFSDNQPFFEEIDLESIEPIYYKEI